MKQGKGVSTNWRKEHHKSQTKINLMEKKITTLENINFVLRYRIGNVCRKVGWVLIGCALLLCLFDFFAAYLEGTKFSFRYQMGLGLNQVLAIAISSGLGLILIYIGYKGKK